MKKKSTSFRLSVEQIEDRITPSGTPADVFAATQQIQFNTQILQFVTDEKLVGNSFLLPYVGNFLNYVNQTNTVAVNELNSFLNNLMTQNAGNFQTGDFFAEHFVDYSNVLNEGVMGLAYAQSFAGTLSIPLSPVATPNNGGSFAPPINNGGNNGGTTPTTADLTVTNASGNVSGYGPGTFIDYTIVVKNNGPANVTGATVSDVIPANITGAAWTATYSGGGSGAIAGAGNISTSINLPIGATATFTIFGNVTGAATGNIVNTLTVTLPSGLTDPTPADNTLSITRPQLTINLTNSSGMVTDKPNNTVLGFVDIGNGVRIRDILIGSGNAATLSGNSSLYYIGWLNANGTTFDSQLTPEAAAVFSLGGTIPGFQSGTVGMLSGGIRQIFIPAAQAYGNNPPSNIPVNSDLVFEVKYINPAP